MSRPLVVLDALLLRPRPTGVGRAILEWTDALAASDHGLRFAVLCTHPELLTGLIDRPHWELVPCPGARGGTLRKALWTQLRLPRLLQRLGADLLHCLQFVAPLRPPCPTVVTVHDLGYLRFPGTVEQPRLGYYRWLVPRSLRRATVVVCNSEATAADVRDRFPHLDAPVRVTPFGTPGWVRGQLPATADRQHDAPFLFVGTLEPRKNLEMLLEAYTEFGARRRAVGRPIPRLVVAGGRGWRDSGLRRALQPLVDAGAVVVKDYCGPKELWEHYRMARALLFPSLHEGFGLPILEAMTACLPVLTSDRGAMAEVAGDAALLVDPEDREQIVRALERLTDDPALRHDLVRRGEARWRQWSWESTVKATVAAYDEVLSRRK
jgi:glycosyltransferase involved in cell wall biosynthesis